MDGEIKIGIDVDIESAEKNAEKLKQDLQQVGNEISKSDSKSMSNLANSLSESASEARRLTSELTSADIKLEEMHNEANSLKDMGMWDSYISDSGTVVNNAKDMSAAIDEQFAKTESLRSSLSGVTQELSNGNIQASQFINKYNQAEKFSVNVQTGTSKVADETGKAKINADKLKQSTDGVSKSMNSASSSAKSMSDGIGGGFKKLVKYGLALFSIRSIYQMLSRLSKQWLDSDAQGAAQAKANIESLSQGMSNLLAPVIQTIVGWITTLMGYVNALAKAFFGVEIFSKNISKNTKKGAGNTSKMAKEAKKLSYSFDEAEIATSNIADNLGGAGDTGAGDLPTPSIPTPDISGIMKALETIKKFWLGIWNSGVVQAFMNLVTTIFTVGFASIASRAANLWDNIVTLFYAMLPNLQVGFNNMLMYWTLVFNDMANAVTTWVPIITETINGLVDEIFKTFTPLFVWLSQVWADVSGFMLETWIKYGADILDEIGRFINGAIETFNLIWTEIIDPIIRPALEMLQRLWDEHLKEIVMDIIDFVAKTTKQFLEVWNNSIKPFIDNVVKFLGPIVTKVFNLIWTVVEWVLSSMATLFGGTFGGFRTIMEGILKFIDGVFSGNWSKAWEGISGIVEGIFKGLVGFVRVPLNIIVGIINGFIRGLNRIKLPSFLGGFGVNIPEIPYLARGGVLNRPTLNIAGEAGKEAVVPLENNTGWARDFLGVLDSYGGIGGNKEPQVIQVVMPNGKVLAEVVNDTNKQDSFDMNGAYAI